MKHIYPFFYLILFIVNTVNSQTLDPKFWITNSEVLAIATDGTSTYIGGNYNNYWGPNTGCSIKITTTNSKPDLNFPLVNGRINCIVSDSSGKWYIGGNFLTVGKYIRKNIARLNNDGSVDTLWNPKSDSTVMSIAVSASNVYVGGYFNSIGGQIRNRIAKLNKINGAADTIWNPNANNIIRSIVLTNNDIYIAGDFKTIGSQIRNRIAKLNNTNGAADTYWNPNADSLVICLAINGNEIYAGGYFKNIGGQARNRIAKLNITNGTADTTWNPNANSFIYKIGASGNNIYVGGNFSNIGDQIHYRLARIDKITGLADSSWNPKLSSYSYVYDIAVNDSSVFSVGDKGIQKQSTLTGAVDTLWNAHKLIYGGYALCISLNKNDILIGGSFTSAFGQTCFNSAKITNLTGEVDNKWPFMTNSGVDCIKISKNDVYLGGNFSNIDNQTRYGLAKIDKKNGVINSVWHPGEYGSSDYGVSCLAIDSNDVYASGNFTSIGLKSIKYLAKLNNTNGDAQDGWDTNPNDLVLCLAVSGNDLYAGGNFTNICGKSRKFIAKFNKNTGLLDTNWNPNIDSAIMCITVIGNDVYVGGLFTQIDGQTRHYIAKLNATRGKLDTVWNPNADDKVLAITVNESNVYAGGYFKKIGGHTNNFLAKLNSSNGQADTNWNPKPDNIVKCITCSGSDIFIGGSFHYICGQYCPNLCKIIPNNDNLKVTITSQPQNLSICSYSDTSACFTVSAIPQATTGTLIYQWFEVGLEAIQGATNASFCISGATTGNAGSYYCQISVLVDGNTVGQTKSNYVDLTIKTAPIIFTQPISASVCDGMPLNLSVVVSDITDSATHYQWYQNNTKIPLATSSSIETSSATVDQIGQYQCEISNICGSTLTNEVSVTVKPQTHIITQPTNATFNIPLNFSFFITSTGSGILTYQWYKNGIVISGATSNTFLKNTSSSLDAGSYYCQITGECNTVTSETVQAIDSATRVEEATLSNNSFLVEQNTPNPFEEETELKFNVPTEMIVKIILTDVNGNEVVKLFNGIASVGINSIKVNILMYNLSSGVYFYTLTTQNHRESKRMIVIK